MGTSGTLALAGESTDDVNSSEKSSAINFKLNQIEYEQNYLMSDVNWTKNDNTTTSANEFEITASPKVKGKTSDILEIFSLTIIMTIPTKVNTSFRSKVDSSFDDNFLG